MIDHIQLISVGDMIEAINGQSLLGCRHYEVARLLKELPRGRTFTLKLTEPRKAFGESGLEPGSSHSLGSWLKCQEPPAGGAQAHLATVEGVEQLHLALGRGCWLSAQHGRRMEAKRKLPPHPAFRSH